MDNRKIINDEIDEDTIDPHIYDLYDEYCHSSMERREFLGRAAAMTVTNWKLQRHRHRPLPPGRESAELAR